MVFLHPGSGKNVSFFTQKVRESRNYFLRNAYKPCNVNYVRFINKMFANIKFCFVYFIFVA